MGATVRAVLMQKNVCSVNLVLSSRVIIYVSSNAPLINLLTAKRHCVNNVTNLARNANNLQPFALNVMLLLEII